MKHTYKKYSNWIIVILMSLFLFKSCQSCSRGRLLDYHQRQYVAELTILRDSIDGLYKDIDSLCNIIELRDQNILYLNNSNQQLHNANNHYIKANQALIITNKEILNKNNK